MRTDQLCQCRCWSVAPSATGAGKSPVRLLYEPPRPQIQPPYDLTPKENSASSVARWFSFAVIVLMPAPFGLTSTRLPIVPPLRRSSAYESSTRSAAGATAATDSEPARMARVAMGVRMDLSRDGAGGAA